MTEKEAKIALLLGSLLQTAQQVIESEEIAKVSVEQLAVILYENYYRSCDESIDFLKSLVANYEGYKDYVQEINDKYDAS
ncbi:MAG: hypothetical protein WAQ98_14195 [Blastocatellia bacterium]